MVKTENFHIFRSGIKRQTLSSQIQMGVVTLIFTLIVITCVLSILLLLHSNKVATKGYELRSLQNELKEIDLRNERLQAIVAEKKSITHIAQSDIIQDKLKRVNNLVIVKSNRKLAKK